MRWLRAGLVALLLATPARVFAHGALKSSTPSSGAHIPVAPEALSLVFSESPSLTLTTLQLLGPDGSDIALGPLTRDANSVFGVTASISGALASGVYTVRWQMAGDDGHPTRGSFRFTLALPATMAGTPPVTQPMEPAHENPISQPDGAGFGVESPGYVAIRWVQYTALVIIIGAIAFAMAVLGLVQRVAGAVMVADARARAARLALWATYLLGATAVLRLFAQSYALHGESLAPDVALIGTLLRVTQWGHAWLLEAMAVIVALFAFRRARDGRVVAWRVAAIAGIAVALSMALSGHAAASPILLSLAIIADSVHIIGAGGWLGSLLFMVLAGIPAALAVNESLRWTTIATLVNAFSPTALVFSGMTAVTGVFAAWLHLESIPALWNTRYGQVLLLKLAVLSVTAAIGLYNWQRVKPILDGGPEGTRQLRRSAAVELGVGGVVLLVTAVLVATPTGMDM